MARKPTYPVKDEHFYKDRKKFTVISELHRVIGEDKDGNRTYVGCNRFELNGDKWQVIKNGVGDGKPNKKTKKTAEKKTKTAEKPSVKDTKKTKRVKKPEESFKEAKEAKDKKRRKKDKSKKSSKKSKTSKR